MSFSESCPSSTQATLAAQQTPPKRRRFLPREHSIIIISSSSEEELNKQLVIDSDDEQYFGPQSTQPNFAPLGRRKSSKSAEDKSIEILEDEEFARLVGGFKFSTPLSETTTNIELNGSRRNFVTRKTNLDSFFQECKPTSSRPTKTTAKTTSRVKTTLTNRVAIPVKKKTTTENRKPSKPAPSACSVDRTSFFTTWAAAQAPVTRPATTKSKPRRKPSKKTDVEVVLLSPCTGQKSVRPPPSEAARGRLGEKRDGGLWDAAKRGLEGELYDSEGVVVFSQELREAKEVDTSLEIELYDVSAETSRNETASTAMTKSTVAGAFSQVEDFIIEDIVIPPEIPGVVREVAAVVEEAERPARRRVRTAEIPTGIDSSGMPLYSRFTIPQLQVFFLTSLTKTQNEVKKFGFKASKDKTEMIKLLEECWKAANRPPRPPPEAPSQGDTGTPAPTDWIHDTSSPALRQRLYTRISKTIKSDADQSVYLGILRYEPLVIEDLMEWLERREMAVPDMVVRAWCDKEGVCCVTRESLAGGKRPRY